MILSYYDNLTEAVGKGRMPKGFPPDLYKIVRRKLAFLRAATKLSDLKSPPGNKLHALGRDRAGQHSISVNDQYRICFIWTAAGAERVEFTDYH